MEPQRTDFLAYACSVHIAAAPARVFAIVGDLGRTVEWAGSGHVRSIRRVDVGPIGVGAQYKSSEKITMRYSATSEIVAYEPGKLIRWISKPSGEPVPYHRWDFELAPENQGTRLTPRVRAARASGIIGLIQRLGFLLTKPEQTIARGMDRTIQRVKELAEAGASA
jgi:uncharacterized protein YndB with AHSA1/START domain